MKQTKIDTSLSLDARKTFIEYCADLYETNGTSPVSDAEYDKEYYTIQAMDPDWDVVGGMADDHIYGAKIKHKVICGSLLKSPNPEDFLSAMLSIYANVDLSEHCFALQLKLDGLAICCTYDDGKLQQVVTRGRDGWKGVDVTSNAVHIQGIPETIPCKEEVEFRGECYKDRQDFYKNWFNNFNLPHNYKLPRNFAAGSVNQKDPKVTKERGLDFIAYEVVRKDFDTEKQKLQFIIDNGFATLKDFTKFTKVGLNLQQIARAVKVYMDSLDRPKLSFDIDGIVVKLNDIKVAKSLGTVSGGKKPKANRAVKFPCEQKETEIIDKEYSVGRTGAITIVGLLKPVELGGTTIQRVALHNFDFIKKNGLSIGATVLLQKSGDIIPYVVRKTKDGNTPIEPPDECPACGGDLVWDDNNITLHCKNPACVAQINRSIEHFFKKIGVLGLGKGIIGKLTDDKALSWEGDSIISCLSDMYWKLDNDRKTEHPFRKYAHLKDQFGEKKFENIVESVHSVKEVTLAKFIEALGIANVGTMSSRITDIAPTIDDVDKLTADDLMKIDGFGDKKSHGFVRAWRKNHKEIETLLKFIDIVKPTFNSDKLSGKKFCFTGSFADPTRKEMEEMVIDNGGQKSSVSKNLTALIWDGEIDGGKVQKAKSLGVDIIDQAQFLAMIK